MVFMRMIKNMVDCDDLIVANEPINSVSILLCSGSALLFGSIILSAQLFQLNLCMLLRMELSQSVLKLFSGVNITYNSLLTLDCIVQALLLP